MLSIKFSDDASDSEQDISQDIVETEIWAWGDNSMGQLGLADDLRRYAEFVL